MAKGSTITRATESSGVDGPTGASIVCVDLSNVDRYLLAKGGGR
jgi:hypothetical protein